MYGRISLPEVNGKIMILSNFKWKIEVVEIIYAQDVLGAKWQMLNRRITRFNIKEIIFIKLYTTNIFPQNSRINPLTYYHPPRLMNVGFGSSHLANSWRFG